MNATNDDDTKDSAITSNEEPGTASSSDHAVPEKPLKTKGQAPCPEAQDAEVVLVDWEGPDDPANPKNWPEKKRWSATITVAMFTFMSPLSSSMIAPAASQSAREFGVTNSTVIALQVSIFVLAYALGPLFLGPLSEIYGRSRITQGANLFYIVWNLACGFARNEVELIIFRFFAGIGGSAPLAVGGGVLGDIWRTEERGRAIAIYSLGPLAGPVLGPVCGGWIAAKSTWRWVFWSTSIVSVVIQGFGLFLLRESYAPLLLERKANRLIKQERQNHDPEKGCPRVYKTPFQNSDRTWQAIFSKALSRPFAMFAREPIIQVIGIYMSLVYGIFYLFLTTLPSIFGAGGVYDQPEGISSLHYLALGVGITGCSQANARYIDKLYATLKNRNGGVGRPEFRVPSILPGAIILPTGMLLSGWAAQTHLHWIVTDIGIALVGGGIILVFQSMQIYVVDTFTLHAASALAAVGCLRSIFGFVFPLFAPRMYEALGYGKGNTILAACAIAIGIPAPFLFWIYGERLRGRSRYNVQKK